MGAHYLAPATKRSLKMALTWDKARQQHGQREATNGRSADRRVQARETT